MRTNRITVTAVLGGLAILAGFSLLFFGSGCGSDEEQKNEVLFAESFESDSTIFTTGWGYWRYDSIAVVASDCPDGGSHAVQLRMEECRHDGVCITEILRKFPEADTGDRLELSAWVRVETPAGRGQIRFCTVDTAGGVPWVNCAGQSVASSSEHTWTRISTEFTNNSTWYPPEISLQAITTDSSAVIVLFDRVEAKRLARRKTNPVSF